jgi:hypothetical protein
MVQFHGRVCCEMFSFISNGFQNLSATPRGTVAARLGIISSVHACHYLGGYFFLS